MKTRAWATLLVCLLAAAPGCARDQVVGSGKPVTKEFNVADFDAVDISSTFHVEITRGDSFRVAVTADDNVMEHVKVAKQGSTLKIALAPDMNYRDVTLKATIAMPALQAVDVSGASQATLKGFKSTESFKAKLVGASKLDGKIEAGKVDIEATGASTVSLEGSAKDAKLSAVGASQLQLGDFTLDNATVNLTGASEGTVNAKGKLDYVLIGASRLGYRGNPTIGKRETIGASSASPK